MATPVIVMGEPALPLTSTSPKLPHDMPSVPPSRRLSLIAAMDVHGIRRHTIIDGGVKKADFLDFNPDVLSFLESRRCRLVFVPPYSPDTNPIEMAFSKIKHHVRKAMAVSVEALHHAFNHACTTITASDARNYINHAGYW